MSHHRQGTSVTEDSSLDRPYLQCRHSRVLSPTSSAHDNSRSKCMWYTVEIMVPGQSVTMTYEVARLVRFRRVVEECQQRADDVDGTLCGGRTWLSRKVVRLFRKKQLVSGPDKRASKVENQNKIASVRAC